MTASLTVISRSDLVIRLVSDFARGLRCPVDSVPAPGRTAIRIELAEIDPYLLELLAHVAIAATKTGDVGEPLCQITYQHRGAPSEVTLGLRVAEFDIDAASPGVPQDH